MHSFIINCLAVGFGGFLGAIGRYLIGLIPVKESTLFPFKTFAINLIGCALIALIVVLFSRTPAAENTVLSNGNSAALRENLLLFLKVGICGGFTTFSTFALEATGLIRDGHPAVAFIYMILSVAIGVAVVFFILLKGN